MKKLKFIILSFLSISIFMVSCTKDKQEDTEPETPSGETTAFEFVVSNNYIPNGENYAGYRKWILIYSLENELLYEQEVQNGQTYSHDVVKNEKVNVQLVRYYKYEEGENKFSFAVYTGVSPDVWKLGSDSDPDPIGTIKVNLNDIDKDSYSRNQLSSSGSNWNEQFTENTYGIPQHNNPDFLWLWVQPETGAPLYKWVPEVSLNETVSINQSDLQTMSNSVSIETPAFDWFSIHTYGIDLNNDVDKLNYFNRSFNAGEDIIAFYPSDVLPHFSTYCYSKHGNISDDYTYIGSQIPDKIETISAEANVNNTTVQNYEATINGTVDIYFTLWYYSARSSSTFYYIYGEANANIAYAAPAIPTSISSIDEELLNLGNLEYLLTELNEYSLFDSYDAYIKARFVNRQSPIQDGSTIMSKAYNNPDTKREEIFKNKDLIKRIKQNHFEY